MFKRERSRILLIQHYFFSVILEIQSHDFIATYCKGDKKFYLRVDLSFLKYKTYLIESFLM